MAVQLTTTIHATAASPTTGSATWSHTHEAGGDLLVIAVARTQNNANPDAACTFDGVALTLITSLNVIAYPGYKLYVWHLSDPGSKTANLVFDPNNGGSCKAAVLYASKATGLDASIVGATAKTADSVWGGSAFSVGLTYSAEGSLGFVAHAGEDDRLSNITMSGVTRLALTQAEDELRVAYGIDAAPSGAETYTGAGTGSDGYIASFAVELLAAVDASRRQHNVLGMGF